MKGDYKLKSNDIKNREDIRALMQKAIKENDTEGFYNALDNMMECIRDDVTQQYEAQLDAMRQDMDRKILAERGTRQLTSKEKEYYEKLSGALSSRDPKQALANIDVVMPHTVVNSVFSELQTAHPLLDIIDFIPSGGAVKLLMNTNGYQEAVWGKLCAEIVQEITGGFKEVDTNLLKLSAFIPVCKAMLELGPEWLDSFIRQTLYEAISNGLEAGIVAGDGNEKPIGMTRQVGDGVTVTGGVYPEKAKIKVSSLDAGTVGNLLALLAVDANGKPRRLDSLVFIVNSADYYSKVMPATTIMAPDGTYRNDVMPYPMAVIPTPALDPGEAIIGIADRYFAAAGTSTDGRIEYSDEYQFLEDNRVYLIKVYANGMPKDNNSFLFLDISDLQPLTYKVTTVTPPDASDDATLTDIKIGSLTLSPTFAANTTTYTAATTNATNTIAATPANAGATIDITVGDTVVNNGAAATWATGANTVTIKVTAADGTTTKTYTVTVTKS